MDISVFREMLSYNPDTGIFTWIRPSAMMTKPGDIAGAIDHQGYLMIGLGCKKYLSHRIAWAFTYGSWPDGRIDHIDGNKANNKIANLRIATVRENACNTQKHRNGHLAGTTWNKQFKCWRAQMWIGKKRKHLGTFPTEQLAHEAYLQALRDLG